MKKYIAMLLGVVLLLTGCNSQAAQTVPTTTPTTEVTTAPTETTAPVIKPRQETRIYISMPDESDPYWNKAGNDLLMLLQNLQYQATLGYAQGDAREQAAQLEEALNQGADCLIVAAVDTAALTHVGDLALEKKVPIVAYDRLLMDTEAVTYYVSYDYKGMGVAMGQHIAQQVGLDNLSTDSAVTIEFFMGSPDDSSAFSFYKGIMEVLQPYLESGTLVCKTGRTAFEDTCVIGGDPELVRTRLTAYLKESYRGSAPTIICTVSDDLADMCIQVLEEKKVRTLPLITGCGFTDAGYLNILNGKQSMTFSTNLLELNEQCMQLVDDLLTGKTPQVNETADCHNNAHIVPAWLCGFELITMDNLPADEPETEPTETTVPPETEPIEVDP